MFLKYMMIFIKKLIIFFLNICKHKMNDIDGFRYVMI
jgi:hypothetical protein